MNSRKVIFTYRIHNTGFDSFCQAESLSDLHLLSKPRIFLRLNPNPKSLKTIESKNPYKYHILNKLWENKGKPLNSRYQLYVLIQKGVFNLLILNKIAEPPKQAPKQAFGDLCNILQIKKLARIFTPKNWLKNWLGSKKAVKSWSVAWEIGLKEVCKENGISKFKRN